MKACEEEANNLFEEFASQDTDFGSILAEWRTFKESIHRWHGVGELALLNYLGTQAES
jgi:TRAP-type mannitol/chloroaromatic compound transport system substrate-binding protein